MFAITQVTTLIVDNPTAAGFARGALVLWLVWWGWGGFAWMTNAVSIESRDVRMAFLCVTLGCFFVALGVPGAYGSEALWFAIPYVAIRVALTAVAGVLATVIVAESVRLRELRRNLVADKP